MYFTVLVYLLLLCLILLTCQTHEAVQWSGCCVQYYCERTQGDLRPWRQLAQVPPGNQSLCSVLPGWPCYPTTPSGDAAHDGHQRRWWTDWWRSCVSMSSVWFNPWLNEKGGGGLLQITLKMRKPWKENATALKVGFSICLDGFCCKTVFMHSPTCAMLGFTCPEKEKTTAVLLASIFHLIFHLKANKSAYITCCWENK